MRAGLEELHRARRRGYSISVMMIQIDHYDALAANRGRAATDNAIRHVAAAIQRDIRLYVSVRQSPFYRKRGVCVSVRDFFERGDGR
jgi:hypothetical protein